MTNVFFFLDNFLGRQFSQMHQDLQINRLFPNVEQKVTMKNAVELQ